jgi:hypothetical protein
MHRCVSVVLVVLCVEGASMCKFRYYNLYSHKRGYIKKLLT